MVPPTHPSATSTRIDLVLGKANDALARSRALAQSWLVHGHSRGAPRELLTPETFHAAQDELLKDWYCQAMAERVDELKAGLRADGFSPGRLTQGANIGSDKSQFGRYACLDINDPVFGDFVIRIWFTASWEKGVELSMGAYLRRKVAHLLKYPPAVGSDALALVSVSARKIHWDSLTLADAKAAVLQWRLELVEPGGAGNLGLQWYALHRLLESTRAP